MSELGLLTLHWARCTVQVQSLPKYTPNSLTRAVKSEAVPYTELANRYTGKTSSPDLAAIVAKHQAEFQAVRNVYIVLQVLQHMQPSRPRGPCAVAFCEGCRG